MTSLSVQYKSENAASGVNSNISLKISNPTCSKDAKYTKIPTSRWAYIPIISSLGIFILIQTYRFQKALNSGDIETAKKALELGAIRYTTSKKILKLAQTNQIESIKLLIAQIDVFSRRENQRGQFLHPNRLPYSAEAFISARDDHKKGQNETLLEILPNEIIGRTINYNFYSPNYQGKNDIQRFDPLGTERVYLSSFQLKNSRWYGYGTVFEPKFL